ncbi:tpr repeat region protein, partial [Cystoisospora suis]
QEMEEFEKILEEENVILFDCLIGKDGRKAKDLPHLAELGTWRKLKTSIEEKTIIAQEQNKP